MDDIRRLITIFVGLILSMLTTISVCINGWGLQPKSWSWIIGMNLLGHILALFFYEIGRKDD